MKRMMAVATLALLVLLSMSAMAATPPQQAKTGLAGGPAGRYDQQIQQAVSQKIHEAKQLQRVNSSVEDGIVTLTGTVDLYQDKLAAAKKVKKLANVNGVRNEIAVAGETVPDGQLQMQYRHPMQLPSQVTAPSSLFCIAFTRQAAAQPGWLQCMHCFLTNISPFSVLKRFTRVH